MNQPAKKINPSLRRKSAARMAAAQCLYRQAITGDTASADEQAARLKKQLTNNTEEQKLMVGMALEPDYSMLTRILKGVMREKADINIAIDAQLQGGWSRERMSVLMVALLQCGAFEMLFDKDLGHPVVISEYTQLARHFFDAKEVDFVHAVLSRLTPNG
jgi:transcription antitermination protein NusB